ncbi:MAG: fructosamine kinase family protein [Brooklawnia sp.]|uniref:fructosamine kinase family protein n=1 Tax=Brooklawnia sp. TaxID=2699740 RepID=UPI003C70AFE9
MTQHFVKTGSPDEIRWEAHGLAWLADAEGAAVVPVLAWDERKLVEQRLEPVATTPVAAAQFGRDLARTHAAGAASFGCGPEGWDDTQPGWIGRARLPLGHHQCWGEFYAELRLLPHARAAHDRRSLPTAGLALIERVCERLRDGEFDDGRPPARIHGDLWGGNVLTTEQGIVMIDPAAHGGHGQTDLAMLALFGCTQLRRVEDAYAEAAGLPSDWRSRTGLHQLHPLLVHAELFGSGYGAQAMAVGQHYA